MLFDGKSIEKAERAVKEKKGGVFFQIEGDSLKKPAFNLD